MHDAATRQQIQSTFDVGSPSLAADVDELDLAPRVEGDVPKRLLQQVLLAARAAFGKVVLEGLHERTLEALDVDESCALRVRPDYLGHPAQEDEPPQLWL